MRSLVASTRERRQPARIKARQYLADDFIREYRINGRKSLDDVQTRWDLHLKALLWRPESQGCNE
jgi:hypothetical protein